ncbi:MAG: alcohol dehydrogenase, partial [Ellagibacter isourolithinifaciens]|nr:alcohol dehydrogenase [Ellagibacter isourolithinifaciens]
VGQGVSTASEPAAAEGSASEGVVGESTAGEGVSATVSPGGTLDSQASSAAPLAGHKKEKEPVALSDVDALYQDKGANVISLHTADPSAYEEGTILKRGGKRYGIFSVTREYSRILIDEKVKYFTDQKVDYVIALCPEESYLKNAENIDIVITTADSTISSMGESRNGAFYVSTPKIGSVGAILISPSNVVSAKTISEL